MRVLLERSVFWPSRHSQNVLALRPEPFTFFPSPQSPPFENRSFFTRLGPDALCNPSVINHTYSCGGVDIDLEKQNSRDRGCEEDAPFVLRIYIRPASGSEREKVNPRPAIPAILLLSTNAFFLKRVSALQHTRAGGTYDVPVALDVDDQRGGVRSSGFSMLTPKLVATDEQTVVAKPSFDAAVAKDGQSDGRLPDPARTNESKRSSLTSLLDKLVASKQGCSWFRLRLLDFPDRTGAVQKADTNSWSARGVTSGQSRPINDRASFFFGCPGSDLIQIRLQAFCNHVPHFVRELRVVRSRQPGRCNVRCDERTNVTRLGDFRPRGPGWSRF